MNQLTAAATADAREFRQKTPDYDQAYQFFLSNRDAELAFYGVPQAERARINYGLATDEYWSIRQFGSTLICVNGSDTAQYIDVDAGTNLAALPGSPPHSRYVEIVGDFVQLGGTAPSRRAVKWSGRNDSATWSAYTKDSDGQTFPDGGDVMG